MKIYRFPFSFAWGAVGVAVLFWLLESFFDAFVFREGMFLERLLLIEDHNELWMRLLIIALILLLGVSSQIALGRQRQAAESLRESAANMKIYRFPFSFVWGAVGVAVLFWLLESFFDAFVFRQGMLLERLLLIDDANELWMRLLIIALILLLGVSSQIALGRQRQAAESLRESAARTGRAEQQLRDAIENIPASFMLYDADGRLVLCNGEAREFFPEVAGMLTPGVRFEELVRARAERAAPAQAAGRVDEWVAERVDRFRHPGPPIEEQHADGRWTQAFERRTSDGGTVCVRVDITDLKQREEELRTLSRAIEQSPVSVIIADTGGNIEYVNPKFTQVTGYAADEVIGKNPRILKSGHTTPDEYEALWKTIASGGTWRGEFRNRKKNGELFWESVSISPIKDAGGTITHFVAVKEDVTERKRAEEALRESEQRIRLITDSVPAFISYVDTDERYRFVNEKYEEWFGRPRAEIIGQRVEDVVGPAMYQAAKPHISAALSGKVVTFETEMNRPSGASRHVHVTFTPEFGERGDVVGFCALVHDLTELKQAEEALRQYAARLSAILFNIVDGLITTDEELTIETFNPAAESTFGYSADEVIGRHINMLIPESLRDAHGRHVKNLLGKGRSKIFRVNREVIARRKDGTIFPMEVSVGEVRLGSRRMFVASFRDITERKAAEELRAELEAQLFQAQKMEAIGTLAGGIAHDFNNILTGMVGFSYLALEALPEQSEVRGDIAKVIKGIERASSLVDQILAFSRRGTDERNPIGLHRVVEEALTFLRASVPSTIAIRANIAEHAGVVLADSTQIYQVLLNLCGNAAQAIGEQIGVLEVTLTGVDGEGAVAPPNSDVTPRRYVKLVVSDTGHGMDEATRERVFEPFFTTREVGKGTGLGLSVVHGIVGRHGGTITVESEPGRGATFTIHLPCIDRVERAATAPEEQVPPGSERVLLVDDEEPILQSQARFLRRLGYKVETVQSSAAAWDIFRDAPQRFDIVVTDQTMPEMPGDRLAREILKMRPEIPVVLCSGLARHITNGDAEAPGIREFMMKPINLGDLARTIRRLLD